ncbi:MAG: DUF6036 family nucleotidyltransferase [Armatimonadota bacterium]
MREVADADRIRRFMRALGVEADVDTRMYFTGGATAVLYGWRPSTIDVDIKFVPESDRIYRAIPRVKESLRINVELASPLDFIPVPPGWEDRSQYIAREGSVSYHHFDLYAQALAKVERGHSQDLDDLREMIHRGLIDPSDALQYFSAIEPSLYRFPALDPASFRRAVQEIFRAR